LQNNNAKTTPIPRFAQEQALKVKPMLELVKLRDKMNKKLIKILPYLCVSIVGIGIYIIALIVQGKFSDLLVNIAASFFSIPLLLLFYEKIKISSDKKLNFEIDDYAKVLVDKELLSTVNQLSKLIFPLEIRDSSLNGVSTIIQLKQNDIESEILSNKYLGFQVYKNWEIADLTLTNLLNNSFICSKIDNEKVILIIQMLKNIKTLKMFLKRENLYIEIDETINDFKISKGNGQDNNFPDRYMLLKHIVDDKFQVCDFGDIKKYDLNKCLKVFKVNSILVKNYSDVLFKILNTFDKWVELTGNEIIIDQEMFRLRKIS